MKIEPQNIDKAGRTYWDTTERNQAIEMRAFAPSSGVRHFGRRAWHRMFSDAFSDISGKEQKLLELGCGGSNFLPYFARQFDFQVFGMDYSERGCELAGRMCKVHGISARIICSDFFRAPIEMIEQFDVVVSCGVMEHFTDSSRTLIKFAEFLKPGGLIITTIPNMGGLTGMVQRLISRATFDKHMVLGTESLRNAHKSAGLLVLKCDYFMFLNFGVINPGPASALYKKLLLAVLKSATGVVWALESIVGPFRPNPVSSPYLFCIARKLE